MENCFQNMTCFYWIKLISFLIYLKYWYYNTLPLPHLMKFHPGHQKSLFNTTLIVFFIGFPILSYPIRPRATLIGYTKLNAKANQSNLLSSYIQINTLSAKHATYQKIRAFKRGFSFKVRQHGQQQLYLQYKVCWVLYKMVGTLSFSQHYLCMQPPMQSRPEIRSTTPNNFYLPILSILVHKNILTIPTNTPVLYTSTIFHLPIFACSHP